MSTYMHIGRDRTGTVSARAGTGLGVGWGAFVSFESWNQQVAWHPPLLNPSRNLAEAHESMVNIRGTALRATAGNAYVNICI